MRLFGPSKDDVTKMIETAVQATYANFVSGLQARLNLLEEVEDLKEERARLKDAVQDLEITHKGKAEEWERREREVEHKVGLERKRQQDEELRANKEIELAKREAKLEVEQSGLDAAKAQFDENITLVREELGKQVTYLQGIMEKILARLPDANMAITASTGTPVRAEEE